VRRRSIFAALAAALVVGAVIAAVLATRSGARVATVPVPGSPGFPAPPIGAVVYSRELGADALALGVVPQHGRVVLQASVLSGEGRGVAGLKVTLAGRAAEACGTGCYRTTVAPTPRAVDVSVGGARWRVTLPQPWPPSNGTALVHKAEVVWRSLRSLSFREHLASGPGAAVRSAWRVQAPDRVAYSVNGGPAGIIVGGRRWDRTPGSARWVESAQTALTQPVPPWVSVTDAWVLARGAAWRVSFFDPQTPAWFTVSIDRRTFRTLAVDMITTAHFMHDVYGAFNATPSVRPPR
jgi:hypothetical protein